MSANKEKRMGGCTMKDNSLKKNGILAIISYISLYGIQAMLKTKGVDAPVNNSIFSVLIVVGVFFC